MNKKETRMPFADIMPLITESFRQGLTATIPVAGNSMWPLFSHKRDCAVLSPVDGDLRRGDVPLYRRPDGKYVLHRIIRVTKDEYVFTGDAQTQLERLPKTCVVAVMTAFVRKGKTVDCCNKWYRFYSHSWMLVRPLRPLLIWLAKSLIKIKKR
ncbi:MAG: S24/S26 family peptidase [Clostridia bacterium]|jgi:hypothetical protein|nr:S24/S26 family peptidase [Clostridia bacterium]